MNKVQRIKAAVVILSVCAVLAVVKACVTPTVVHTYSGKVQHYPPPKINKARTPVKNDSAKNDSMNYSSLWWGAAGIMMLKWRRSRQHF